MPIPVENLFDDNAERDIIQFDNKVEEGCSLANVEQTALLEYVDKHILEVARERELTREVSKVRTDTRPTATEFDFPFRN
jgi:hypothetical protein